MALACALLVSVAAVLAGFGVIPGTGAASAGDDPYEPNDYLGQANGPLGLGSYEAFVDPVGDVDFFCVDVPARCRILRVSLTRIPENCNYDLEILDASGESEAVSDNESNQDELVQLQDPGEGRYYIKVFPVEGSSGSKA